MFKFFKFFKREVSLHRQLKRELHTAKVGLLGVEAVAEHQEAMALMYRQRIDRLETAIAKHSKPVLEPVDINTDATSYFKGFQRGTTVLSNGETVKAVDEPCSMFVKNTSYMQN
jgi:hypothetical protein